MIRHADRDEAAQELQRQWKTETRWRDVRRDYEADDVVRLRGTQPVEHTLARLGAQRLWTLVREEPYVAALGALTGGQAVQMVRAGLKAIYLSGWQVAADGNNAEQMYPDLSLYPADSVPTLLRRINNALRRADQVDASEGRPGGRWFVPLVADGEAGFGGPLNALELSKSMIEAGAAAIHFEDQLASAKKCGHMGGKVLIPTSHHIRTLTAARLAADLEGVPTLIIARTDARGARLLSNDVDEHDREFITGQRTVEGFHHYRAGIDAAIERSIRYAPYADLLWFETSKPDLDEAHRFARAIHRRHPGKLLAYNLSPSFHWTKHLQRAQIEEFQEELGALGYKFQFVTLAGFHSMNAAAFDLAHDFARRGMPAYVQLQEREFELEHSGYSAVRHQHEVGAGYFDELARLILGPEAETLALEGSTENEQFELRANGARPILGRARKGGRGRTRRPSAILAEASNPVNESLTRAKRTRRTV